jgi:ribonucleoside-triphosphate reductase
MPENTHRSEIVDEIIAGYASNMRNRDVVVIKRNGTKANYDLDKIRRAIRQCFKRCHVRYRAELLEKIDNEIKRAIAMKMVELSMTPPYPADVCTIKVEEIQDIVEKILMDSQPECAKEYILYRNHREQVRSWVDSKEEFIRKYKESSNTANATIDDNSNVTNKNIGILNTEIHKEDNVQISRRMVVRKLRKLFPDFDAKQYERDLADHIIYKHDESSFAGAVAPYCVALTMYPFLDGGIKGIGGLSAKPKNLDSYCGMLVNMIFAISAQFAGAVACPEALLYFDYFARKEWGDDYYLHTDDIVNPRSKHPRTIREQIHQHFQQVIYSINQPAAARGLQSAFVNFSYYDKAFYEGMFGNFAFPDFTKPIWESFNWLQKDFMQWFNNERKRCVLTFPVESFAMVYQNHEFLDPESADFVAAEYARGHSFFTYISDTVDSLSSCCRLKNKLQTKEFNFTNGNMGLQTGSKSVITINLNRIVQDWVNYEMRTMPDNGVTIELGAVLWEPKDLKRFVDYLGNILDRIYKYHTAYNELLWDMKDAHLLPVYDAGFIDLNKQYLTIGINGLNQAAEFLGLTCNDNPGYKEFCQTVFGAIAAKNKEAGKEKFNGHTLTFNTEQVPAESLAIKNYNWDKEDDYWVPEDTNLYASYIFKPNDPTTDVFEKLRLHGREYIGDYLDGGSAAHINLEEHLTKDQYKNIIKYAAEQGTNYFTFNIPMTECCDCGHIVNGPVEECPECHSHNIKYWTRIIGYLTAVKSWSAGRQEEFKTRVFHSMDKDKFRRMV